MAIQLRPDNKAWGMTDFPNLEILPHPYNPVEEPIQEEEDDPIMRRKLDEKFPIELPRASYSKLRSLEDHLQQYLGKGNPARARIILDTRPDFEDIEDRAHSELSRKLYSKNRRYGGALIPLFVSEDEDYGFPSTTVSRIISATDILKKLTNSRPNRRQIEGLRLQLPTILKSNPQMLAKHDAFSKDNHLHPNIGIADLLGYHIFNRLGHMHKDQHIDGLQNFLSSKDRPTHRNPYHQHINEFLLSAIQRHLQNRRK